MNGTAPQPASFGISLTDEAKTPAEKEDAALIAGMVVGVALGWMLGFLVAVVALT